MQQEYLNLRVNMASFKLENTPKYRECNERAKADQDKSMKLHKFLRVVNWNRDK